MTQWAVPWFFLVSGLFACKSVEKYGLMVFAQKKVLCLVIPYVLWLAIPWFLLSIKNVNLWYLKSLIAFMSVLVITNKIVPQFRYRRCAIAAIFCAVLFGVDGVFHFGLCGTPTSPVFFILGYLLSERLLGCTQPYGKRFLVTGLAIGLAIVLRAIWFVMDLRGVAEMALRNLCVVSMIVAIWLLVDLIDVEKREVSDWMKNTFFVYCFHGPVLMAIAPFFKPLFERGVMVTNIVYIAYLFIAPALFFAFAAVIKRLAPKPFAILSGGR